MMRSPRLTLVAFVELQVRAEGHLVARAFLAVVVEDDDLAVAAHDAEHDPWSP